MVAAMIVASNTPVYTGAACWRAAALKSPLTVWILNEFVEKILVHECARKSSIATTHEVEIDFNWWAAICRPTKNLGFLSHSKQISVFMVGNILASTVGWGDREEEDFAGICNVCISVKREVRL